MKKLKIPGYGTSEIEYICLDLNGTINYFGERPRNLKDYVEKLKKHFKIYILSANTRGDLDSICEELNVEGKIFGKNLREDDAKLEIIKDLNPDKVIYIGNGNNDKKALEIAKIGICVIGEEGASKNAILFSDIVINNIINAFKIILDEKALIATLRF